jgi:phytoene dehydrogenase-like protein
VVRVRHDPTTDVARHPTNQIAPAGMTDAIVIGSGPNGLVAANVLADAGWEVTVFEAASQPGGAVRSDELIEPGFVNDWCSAFYPLAASPITPIASLRLEDWGLRWDHAPLVVAHPAPDGSCPVLSRGVETTATVLEQLHHGDGGRWRALHDRWSALARPLLGMLFGPFPPVRSAARLAWTVRTDAAELARFMLLPVRRLTQEAELGPEASRLLAGLALHADLAPENALSGFYGWLLAMLGHDHGFPVAHGGASEITSALVARLGARGGAVRCSSAVRTVSVTSGAARGVVLESGEMVKARRAVLADVDANHLYLNLLADLDLPPRLARGLRHRHRDHGTIKVDWNLNGPIPWSSRAAAEAGTVHLVDSIDHLTSLEAQLAQGVVPGRPFLIVGQQHMADPSRQPAGCETAWAYTHVPQLIRGDEAGERHDPADGMGWSRLADRMEARIEEHAPGFGQLIRGRHVAGPADFEAHDPNLVGGSIGGGTAQLHQQLFFRPTPGLGRPETFVRRLYLASASAHPGGGAHGACGNNAARAALLHARLRR